MKAALDQMLAQLEEIQADQMKMQAEMDNDCKECIDAEARMNKRIDTLQKTTDEIKARFEDEVKEMIQKNMDSYFARAQAQWAVATQQQQPPVSPTQQQPPVSPNRSPRRRKKMEVEPRAWGDLPMEDATNTNKIKTPVHTSLRKKGGGTNSDDDYALAYKDRADAL